METVAAMPAELTLLGWSAALALVLLVIHAFSATADIGLAAAVKPRDENPQIEGVFAGRARRAWFNFLETYPLFVGLDLALVVSGQTGGLGLTGGLLWFWMRLAHAPIYYAGISYVRTLVWFGSIIGLLLMVVDLLT